MTIQPSSFGSDSHLYPLYLKWAAENFRDGKTSQAMSFFNAACGASKAIEGRVYKQIWKLQGRPQGDLEYGRKSFHDRDGLFSPPLEKALAIERILRKLDVTDLGMRENQVHKCLWIIHGRPAGDFEYGRHAFSNTHGRFSSIQDKLAAARMYANECRVLTWHVESGQVSLIKREDGDLETVVSDEISGKTVIERLNTEGRSTESVVSILSRCDVVIDNEHLAFSRSSVCEELPEPFDFPEDNQQLQLLVKDGLLVWRLLDRTAKKVSLIYAVADEVLTNLSILSEDARKSYMRDFHVYNDSSVDGRLLRVYFEKIKAPSKLDPSQTIDRDNWVVTLINGGASSACTIPVVGVEIKPFGHAMIAYEGIEGGIQFLNCVHLTQNPRTPKHPGKKSNEAEIEFIDNWNGTVTPRTATWRRTRDQVNFMIGVFQSESLQPIPFSVIGQSMESLGSKAIGYMKNLIGPLPSFKVNYSTRRESIEDRLLRIKANIHSSSLPKAEYNCLTWNIRLLKCAGIELPPPSDLFAEPIAYIDWISTNPKSIKIKKR